MKLFIFLIIAMIWINLLNYSNATHESQVLLSNQEIREILKCFGDLNLEEGCVICRYITQKIYKVLDISAMCPDIVETKLLNQREREWKPDPQVINKWTILYNLQKDYMDRILPQIQGIKNYDDLMHQKIVKEKVEKQNLANLIQFQNKVNSDLSNSQRVATNQFDSDKEQCDDDQLNYQHNQVIGGSKNLPHLTDFNKLLFKDIKSSDNNSNSNQNLPLNKSNLGSSNKALLQQSMKDFLNKKSEFNFMQKNVDQNPSEEKETLNYFPPKIPDAKFIKENMLDLDLNDDAVKSNIDFSKILSDMRSNGNTIEYLGTSVGTPYNGLNEMKIKQKLEKLHDEVGKPYINKMKSIKNKKRAHTNKNNFSTRAIPVNPDDNKFSTAYSTDKNVGAYSYVKDTLENSLNTKPFVTTNYIENNLNAKLPLTTNFIQNDLNVKPPANTNFIENNLSAQSSTPSKYIESNFSTQTSTPTRAIGSNFSNQSSTPTKSIENKFIQQSHSPSKSIETNVIPKTPTPRPMENNFDTKPTNPIKSLENSSSFNLSIPSYSNENKYGTKPNAPLYSPENNFIHKSPSPPIPNLFDYNKNIFQLNSTFHSNSTLNEFIHFPINLGRKRNLIDESNRDLVKPSMNPQAFGTKNELTNKIENHNLKKHNSKKSMFDSDSEPIIDNIYDPNRMTNKILNPPALSSFLESSDVVTLDKNLFDNIIKANNFNLETQRRGRRRSRFPDPQWDCAETQIAKLVRYLCEEELSASYQKYCKPIFHQINTMIESYLYHDNNLEICQNLHMCPVTVDI